MNILQATMTGSNFKAHFDKNSDNKYPLNEKYKHEIYSTSLNRVQKWRWELRQ